MKRAILPIAFAFLCSPAWAQQAPAPAKPQAPHKAKPAAKALAEAKAPADEAKAPAEKKPAAQKVASDRKSRRHEDARHCLDEGSDLKIIKCAEDYL